MAPCRAEGYKAVEVCCHWLALLDVRRVAYAMHVRRSAALGSAHEDCAGDPSPLELSRSSNTGLLAHQSLVNSDVHIRGESRETLDLSDLLSPNYQTLLFYPSADALELTRELACQDSRPIQLIVPDGTWRQARKIHSRHPELRNIPRVKISTPNRGTFQLRAQSRPERMATLQAIACALRIIEGDLVAARLMKLYHARVDRTLRARGLRWISD